MNLAHQHIRQWTRLPLEGRRVIYTIPVREFSTGIEGAMTGEGTLCGYVADGNRIARYLVAIAPGHRVEVAAGEVEDAV